MSWFKMVLKRRLIVPMFALDHQEPLEVLDPHGEDRSCKCCIASLVLFPSGSIGLVGGLKCVSTPRYLLAKGGFYHRMCKKKKKKKKSTGWLAFVRPGETFTNRDSWRRKTQLSNPK